MPAADILFVHANFPAQFRNHAALLTDDDRFRVFAVGGPTARPLRGVRLRRYQMPRQETRAHPFARRLDGEATRAEEVMYALIALKGEGVSPSIIFAHPGWGETLPIKAVFPDAKLILYCEYFYRPTGSDADFDAEVAHFGVDGRIRIAMKNASTLLALEQADGGISPTAWQRSTFPPEWQHKIRVLHEGIDTGRLDTQDVRSPFAQKIRALARGGPILTFVSRSLEPYRGFHSFMRALPAIQAGAPDAHVFLVGRETVSYGTPPEGARSWKEAMLRELGGRLDLERIHFLGNLDYPDYLALLGLSDLHTYLTYPFVLSWSLIEALALGCLVLASDTEPVREVMEHGRNGILVPFFEPRALANKALDVLADPGRFQPMRERARREARQHFDWDRAIRPSFARMMDEFVAPELY